MPVTKDTNIEEKEKKVRTRKTTAKKTTSKVETEEKPKAKKVSATITKTTKKAVTKKSTASKTTATKKKATTKKTTTAKKTTTKKTTRTTRKKKLVEEIEEINEPKVEVIEYYDLPYRYNQTIVKVLAQTPTTLFIYWDISDDDRKAFVDRYGESFFYDTKPVLIIHNNTMHYSFEIDIDDFANSWYLHVNDSNCDYKIELGRRKKYEENNPINIENNYLPVVSSNNIETPNDHILFDRNVKTLYFKDVKTNIITARDITSFSFLRNMGKIYSIFDLQTDFNENNWLENLWRLNLNNPSSGNPTSTFK